MSVQDSANFLAAKDAYYENADYSESGKSAKAELFVTAIRRLLMFPEQMTHGEETFRFNHRVLQEQLKDAQKMASISQSNSSQIGVFEFCRE